MFSTDLLWYRGDRSPAGANADAPHDFSSARYNTLRTLRQKGIRVRLVYHHPVSDWSSRPRWDPDVRVVPSIGIGRMAELIRLLTLSWYLGSVAILHRPRVVMTDIDGVLAATPWAALSAIGLLRTRFCLDLRSTPVELEPQEGVLRPRLWVWRYGAKLWLSRRLMQKATFITEGLREAVEHEYGIRFPRAGYWSSGVDTSLFCPAESSKEEPGEAFVIIYHGTISPTRGLDDLIEAFGLAFEREKDLRLLILGADKSDPVAGPIIKRLESRCEEMGVADSVQFLPRVPYDRVPSVLQRADVGVVPWKNRPWWRGQSPLKLMEYLGCGLPTVVTDVDANRRVIRNSCCGVYCKPDNPECMAAAILRLHHEKMSQPESFLARREAGRALAVGEYSWDVQAERLISYLELRG